MLTIRDLTEQFEVQGAYQIATYDYDTDTRTITKIGKVFDVSVVDQPFYNATDVSVARNNNDEFLERRNQLRKEHEEEIRKQELQKLKDKVLEKLG